MSEAKRIDPHEAREHLARANAMLVCAYDDDDKCSRFKIPGSISLSELADRLDFLPADQEIILYCA